MVTNLDTVIPMPRNDVKKDTLSGRVLLAHGIREGIPEPPVFEPDILLKGVAHHFFAEAGSAKTWLALWLTVQAIRRGERVLYLDAENGRRTISERLELLGVNTDRLDEVLHYYSYPNLDSRAESVQGYLDKLDDYRPELIVFDSWVNFLSACGMSEDSNTDVTNWSIKFLHPANLRGITTIILDHVGHADKTRHRAAMRKRDEVQVQWALNNTEKFNRKNVGRVVLVNKKDREGWLPEKVAFKMGGSKPFTCERTDVPRMTKTKDFTGKTKLAVDFIKEQGDKGCSWSQLVDLVGSKSTANYVLDKLQDHVSRSDYDNRYRYTYGVSSVEPETLTELYNA